MENYILDAEKGILHIKDEIEKKYSLKNVEIVKNEDSTDGNVYNIYTEENKYVLKIYKDLCHVKTMIKLYEELSKKQIYVPYIIKNIENQLYTIDTQKYMVMYSYMSGKQLGLLFKQIPENISIMLANELRNFHNKTKNLNDISLKDINFTNKTERKSALHFDLTRCNIFYDESKNRIGFIDFDDAKYGESIIDVSILITNLYFSKTRGSDIDGMKCFINAYYKDDLNLKKMEIPLIKEIATKWVDDILQYNCFETSTIDSLEIKKKLINKINFYEI